MSLLEAIEKERATLNKKLEELATKKAEIDAEIASIKAELKAIDAYETAKTGKKDTKPKGKRNSGIRTQLLDTIKASQGMKRAEILKALNPQNDKTLEQSISNALTALVKSNKVTRTDGIHRVA